MTKFMRVSLCLLLLVSCAAAHGGNKNEFESEDDNYYIEWGFFEAKYINITLKSYGTWASFGLREKGKEGVDAVYASLDYNNSGSPVALDMWAKNGTNFMTDQSQGGTFDLSTFSVTNNGGVTFVFSRLLVTNDSFDVAITQEAELEIFWRYGSKTSNATDVVTAEGSAPINFYVSCDDEDDEEAEMAKLTTHGALMYFTVAFLIPIALVLSRYLKNDFYYWFYAHSGLMIISQILMLVGIILAFQAHDGKFVWGYHTVFAWLFIIAFASQIGVGLAAHFKFDPARFFPPLWPDRIHWYLGRSIGAIGVITVALGLGSLNVKSGWVLYFFWLVVVGVSIFMLEKIIGQTHEGPKGATVIDDEEDFSNFKKEELPRKSRSVKKYLISIFTMLLLTVVPMMYMIKNWSGEEAEDMPSELSKCPFI